MRRLLCLVVLSALSLSGVVALASEDASFGGVMDSLTVLKDYEAARVSSTDKGGGNWDYVRINSGETKILAELTGPGMVTHFWVTMGYAARGGHRKMALRVYFDGEETPSVISPVGDFFGMGHGMIYCYESRPLSVGTEGGMNSFWKMPFYKSAKFVVTNEGRQDCHSFYYYIDYRKYAALPPDLGIFHASYRQTMPCQKASPYIIMDATGHGHYAGVNLSIEQREDNWWGEGDDRFYIDGAEKPALIGTGSEDYFCGAWGFTHEFSYDYYGQPYRAKTIKDGSLKRYTPDVRDDDARIFMWPVGWQKGDLFNVYRYHIEDPVPFTKSLRVEIEHGWINNEQQNNYSSVAYWYQTEPHAPLLELPPALDRLPDYLRLHERPEGKFEGEDFLEAAKSTGGPISEDGMWFWGKAWSNAAALSWVPDATGDLLTLDFPIQKAGKYKADLVFGHTQESGIFEVSFNDKPLKKPLDLYSTYIPYPEAVPLGIVEMTTGEQHIQVRLVGQNKKSKGKRFGLDYIQFQPKEKKRSKWMPFR